MDNRNNDFDIKQDLILLYGELKNKFGLFLVIVIVALLIIFITNTFFSEQKTIIPAQHIHSIEIKYNPITLNFKNEPYKTYVWTNIDQILEQTLNNMNISDTKQNKAFKDSLSYKSIDNNTYVFSIKNQPENISSKFLNELTQNISIFITNEYKDYLQKQFLYLQKSIELFQYIDINQNSYHFNNQNIIDNLFLAIENLNNSVNNILDSLDDMVDLQSALTISDIQFANMAESIEINTFKIPYSLSIFIGFIFVSVTIIIKIAISEYEEYKKKCKIY